MSYFRQFIIHFSLVDRPLYDLPRTNANFVFEKEEQHAFNTLKENLLKAPVLAIYSTKAETKLHCDTSLCGFGSILFQK